MRSKEEVCLKIFKCRHTYDSCTCISGITYNSLRTWKNCTSNTVFLRRIKTCHPKRPETHSPPRNFFNFFRQTPWAARHSVSNSIASSALWPPWYGHFFFKKKKVLTFHERAAFFPFSTRFYANSSEHEPPLNTSVWWRRRGELVSLVCGFVHFVVALFWTGSTQLVWNPHS